MIDGLAMDPLDLPTFAFQPEPESFWNRSTAAVVGGAMNLDSMQSDVETVRGDGLHGSCHVAASFEFAGDPVSDSRSPVRKQRSVEPDDADDSSTTLDDGHDRPVTAAIPSGSHVSAFDRAFDEVGGVGDRLREWYPGKTCSKSETIFVDQLEDFGGMFRPNGLQQEIRGGFER